LLQEIRSKGITASPDVAIRVTNELRNQMKISDTTEKVRQLAKIAVHVDLLEIGLVQSCRVFRVLVIGSTQDGLAGESDDFLFQNGPLSIVLAKADAITPLWTVSTPRH
jgi:hypothetical protein